MTRVHDEVEIRNPYEPEVRQRIVDDCTEDGVAQFDTVAEAATVVEWHKTFNDKPFDYQASIIKVTVMEEIVR